jgi:hypothetical protein
LRATPNRTYKPEEEAEAARVRAAINAETPERKALYKSVSPPLVLHVKIYQPYAETAGGVFYDPWMPRQPPGTAGATALDPAATTDQGSTYEFRNFGGFIRIGPLALTSDEAIRSTLFHEFQHYRLGRERVKGAASTDPAAVALEKMPGDAQEANDEVEVVGLHIESDVRIGKLEPLDFTSNLADMALALATGQVKGAFRDRAFDRIVTAAEASPAGREALVDGFALLRRRTKLTSAQIKLLDPLKARLLALTAPKPKPAKKGP